MGREPAVFLRPGQVLRSEIEGIGVMTNRCIAEV
jgi:2-keto-4-pentenoate hydratase/2-oxohepta-3-ene-1,7-dioic acid hydratase in catechol pathway